MVLFGVTGDVVEALPPSRFADHHDEARLQQWVERCPGLVNVGLPLLSLGCEVQTRHGHAIDALFLDGTGTLVAVELKRGRSPRDVITQLLDYAAHVSSMAWPEVEALCRKHHGLTLEEAFQHTLAKPPCFGERPRHRLAVLAESYDARVLDAALYLINAGTPLALLQFRFWNQNGQALLAVQPVLSNLSVDPLFCRDLPMKWTPERIAALPVHERAQLYANARAHGSPTGDELARMIEACGLPYSDPTCPSDNDPLALAIDEVVFSPEGRAAAIAFTEKGLPALAGIDPLLNQRLKADYGAHNMTTATAGDRVARLMRSLGYKDTGRSAAMPPGCVAKSGMLWSK